VLLFPSATPEMARWYLSRIVSGLGRDVGWDETPRRGRKTGNQVLVPSSLLSLSLVNSDLRGTTMTIDVLRTCGPSVFEAELPTIAYQHAQSARGPRADSTSTKARPDRHGTVRAVPSCLSNQLV